MTDPLALIRARSLADCTPDERVLLAEIDRLRRERDEARRAAIAECIEAVQPWADAAEAHGGVRWEGYRHGMGDALAELRALLEPATPPTDTPRT